MPYSRARTGSPSVESDGGLATPSKLFEMALGEDLDAMPYGAYSDFAAAYNVSHTWVGRMRDPSDSIHVRASDMPRACAGVQSVRAANIVFGRTRIAGRLHHVVPLPEVVASSDLVMDGVTAAAQVSAAVAGLVVALSDSKLSPAERAASEAALVDAHEQILVLLAGVRGAR